MTDRDLISRTDLLNKIFQQAEGRDYYGYNMLNLPYVDLIKSMPTITAEPKTAEWIPVTERLPKPFTFVNATCRSLVDDREDWVIETLYLPIPKEANKNGYSDWGNIPMLNWGEAEVIAWVERIIPEPYKAESEEKPEKPGELKYVGYSSHDDESRYQCPVCKEGYGSWDFINGSVRVMNGLFRCKCGKLLKKPE